MIIQGVSDARSTTSRTEARRPARVTPKSVGYGDLAAWAGTLLKRKEVPPVNFVCPVAQMSIQ